MSGSNRSPFRLDTDLISLRALVAIADEGSFSAAAKQIGRTQSAVSLQIAKLEDRLQTRLLERTSRTVRQTADGETLTAYARRILALADEAMTALTAPQTEEPLRVGFADYLAPQYLHELLARFRRAHAKAGLELRLGNGANLIRALDAGELDVVVAGPEGRNGQVLLREPLAWVGSPDHAPQDGAPVSLVLMPPPCSYRKAAFDALAAVDRPWRATTEANAVQGVQSAIAAGLGISVMARSAVTSDLQILTDGYPPLPETATVAYCRSKTPHPLAERFLSFLEDGLARHRA